MHLFRVSAGLDSLVPGESEILGQVQGRLRGRARRAAARPGVPPGAPARQARPVRDGDRREPGVGARPRRRRSPSRSSATSTAGACCWSAPGGSASSPPAASRRAAPRSPTSSTAAPTPPPTLAARFGAAPIALDQVAVEARRGRRRARLDERAGASSSGRRTCRARRRKPLFFIDIAVPRDVDPAVHELDGCYLYDIDDLEAVVAETLAGRRVEARARREARRRGGGALPRVAGVARGRAGDRVAARARRGDPRGRAREARRRCPSTSAARSSR